MVFITIIESLLLVYFGYVVAYTFIFSIAGLFYRVLSLKTSTRFSKFAVFIPSDKDEKVHTEQVLDNPRKRRISNQYHYLVKYFRPGIRSFFKGDFLYFNSAILRNIQLPRLMFLLLFKLKGANKKFIHTN